MITDTVASRAVYELAQEVSAGLSKRGQKELPAKCFYDEVGSALFEAISHLPEYGLTRADEWIIRRHARSIEARVPKPLMVAELGCGSGRKTRWLLEALSRSQPLAYHPIEISASALAMCKRELDDIHSVRIVGHESEYLDGLLEVAARRPPQQHILVLFLGSTIGNFDRSMGAQFLQQVRRILRPGDALLLGADLEKPAPQLLCAYDDPLGVTAAFNLNVLARLNRELDADFHLDQFRHLVRYNQVERRIEMHLLSTVDQIVTIPGAHLTAMFHAGETIWTESSHKYNLPEVVQMVQRSGFRCDQQWVEEEWGFAESLSIAE